MDIYTLDDYRNDLKKKKKKNEEVVPDTGNDDIYTLEDYRKELKEDSIKNYDISQWFEVANSVINDVNSGSSDDYKFASKTPKYANQIKNLLGEDDTAKQYIESLKGTDSYENIKNSYNSYKKDLKAISDYTNNLADFSSKYKNEKDYTNAMTNVKRAQKYGALKTYDDFTRAIDETDDEDERAWLTAKGENIASADDIYKRIEQLQHRREQSEPVSLSTPGYYNYSLPGGQTNDNSGEREKFNKALNDNNEIERLKQLAESKKAKENINKYYYDVPLDEKDIIYQYKDLRYGDFDIKNGEYSDETKAMLGEDNIKKIEAAKKLAAKKGYNLDEWAKWYQRGEEDDEAEIERQRTKDYANDYPFAASIKSIVENPIRALSTADRYAREASSPRDENDPYINPKTTDIQTVSDIRETISEGIDNPVGSFLYNTGMSMADFVTLLPLNEIPGGQALSLSIMGTEAGTQSANDALERGSTFEQALSTGVASGIAEALFEKLSIDQLKAFKLSGKGSLKDIVQNIFKGMVTEGFEEGATDIANLISDRLINGDTSEFETNKKNYISQGHSEEESDRMAWGDFANQFLQSVAGGALSGGVLNAAAGGINAVSNKLDPTSENSSIADYYTDKLNSIENDDLSALDETLPSTSTAKTSEGASYKLNDKEKKIAKKLTTGENLTADEADIISSSASLQKLINSIPESDTANHANYIKALSSVDTKISKPDMVSYIETDTSGMKAPEALQATAKAQGFNSDTTQAFIDNYDGEMSIPEYTQQFLNYHNLGRTLSPYDTLNPDSYTIANNARFAAYESGKNIYVANAKLDNMLTEAQQRWKNESKGYKTGTVDTSKIEGVQLTQNQKDSVKYISRYSKVGLNIEFYQSSTNAKGRYTSPNGWYNSATHTIGIDINAGRASINEALKNGAMLTTFSHELTHISEHAPEEYTALREAVMNTVGAEAWEEAVSKQYNNLKNNHSEQYKNMSDEQIREAAAKEALAEACSDMLKKADVLEQMIEENPKYAERFINFIKKVVKSLRNLRTRILQDSTIAKEEAKLLEEKADDLQAVVEKYSTAVKEGIKNQNARTAVKSDTEQSGNVQNDDRNNTYGITEKDIKNIQNIGRKSIFNFNSKEISLTEPWAREFWKSIGTKSPFFRAWFGDWRANDNTAVEVATKKGNQRGTVNNSDTGWNINVSAKVENETKNHNFRKNIEAKPYLPYINDIVKKAILLDTYASDKKDTQASLFMHSFYAVADIGNGAELLKLYVEELYNPNSPNDINRAYQLQNIEKSSVSVRVHNINASSVDLTDDIKTISDLWKAVKQKDKHFKPKNTSKVVDEDGKPLIVYHQTGSDFTIFDIEQKGAGAYDNETPSGIFLKPTNKDIGLRGKKQMSLYAHIENPLRVNNRNELVDYYQKNIYSYKSEKSKIDDIDRNYQKRFDDEMERDTKEYQKLWEAWRRGEISEEEYHSARDNSKIENILQEWEEQANKVRSNLKKIVTNHFSSSEYDGIIINYDEGSFGRSTKTYIAFNESQVKSATDNIGAFDKNNPDIRYQDRFTDDEVRDNVHNHFGHTYSWNETGYITTDGQRLDFSGKNEGAPGGRRGVDHRDVLDGYPKELQDKLSGREAMDDFVSRGNIRISPEVGGVYLAVEPSSEQKNRLRDFISRERGEITLDIADKQGNILFSMEYPKRTSSTKILNDITEYFKSGTEPSVSDYGEFRYQDREYINAVESGDTETAQKMVDEAANEAGYTIPLFHGTNEFGFTVIDTKYSDDGISFFVSSSPETAMSYASNKEVKTIGKKVETKYSPEEIAGKILKKKYADAAYFPQENTSLKTDFLTDKIKRVESLIINEKYSQFEKEYIEDIWKYLSDITKALKENETNRVEEIYVKAHDYELFDLWKYSSLSYVMKELNNATQLYTANEDLYYYDNNIFFPEEAIGEAKRIDKKSGVYSFFGKPDNLLIINAEGRNWNSIPYNANKEVLKGIDLNNSEFISGTTCFNTRSISKFAYEQGYDGIKVINVVDRGTYADTKIKASDVYSFFNNNALKSADPVTYDDNGEVIPLSERFNSEQKDIRYQDREHLTTEDELIEKATHSPIDFELDDDLFEEEEQDIDFENMISDDPQLAMELMYKQLAKQSHEVVRFGRDKPLKDIAYRRIANKIINDYSIEHSHLEELTEKVKQFIENNTEASFADDFKNFVLDMRQSLLYSNVLDEDRDERRRAVRDTVKGQTLIIPESAEAEIRSEYESVRNYANILLGYGITVSLRNNTGFMTKTNYSTVNDIITDIQEQTGEMINNDTDGEDAYIELERFLSDSLSPKYNNPYLDGILENIDIAAVEVASDVMTEYTHQLGLVTTHIDSNQTKKLNNQLDIIKAQRDKLLRAAKESSKLNNDLTKYKKRLDTLQADTDKLDEVNWLIEANNEDETLLDQRAELEDKVEEDRKALMRLKTTRPIQKVVDRQIKRAVQAERDKQREIIKRNRSRYAEELNELKDKNYNKLNEYRNARKLSEVVDNIGVLQRKMARALRNPTENVYVPEAFSAVYIDVCDAITEALNNGKVTQVNVKLLQLQSELRKLNNSSTEYEGEISEQLFNSLEYVVQLAQLLDNRLEQLDGRPITKKTISLREANDIYNVLFEIYHTVQDATKQLGREDKRTNLASGAQIDEDMKGAKKFADKAKLDKFKKEFLNGVRTARYYSGYNDDSEIMYHVNALNEGQRKANVYKMNAEKKFLELTEKRKKDYKRSLSEVVEVKYKLNNGEDASIKLTRMTALQALMTWTREQTSSNLVHMERSGMVLPDADLMAKGKVKEALEKSTRVDRVNTSLVVALENTLTDFEQEYRAIAEEYFNKYAKKAINEVSNVIKHRSIAMSEYYIPITVDSNYLVNELEELKFDATLEGMGMLKSTVPRSNLPIIMTSLNNVIARHINDTSKLYGLAIPTRNFKKALNVSFTDTNENGDKIKTGSVRDTIKQVWGDSANKFFNRLIADLESSRNKDNNASSAINKAIGGLRKAMVIKTLTGNISVVIKQAASYPTAGLYLNTSSLMKELAKAANLVKPGNYQKLIDEIDEHTAQHYMRRLGMSQPEINEFLNSWARNIPTALNPAKWIQGVDCLTTALLWNATKEDVKSQYQKSGKAVNTDEYWKDVTDLYDKVIEDTQPMYDSLHRSELQKNTNEVWKSVFMFKTQPLQNTGIIYDSIGNAMAHPKDKVAFKTATKAVTSQVVSLSVFAGMSFAAALLLNRLRRYKDDDGELTFESVIKTIFHDMLINGAGVFEPLFGNEIAELIESTITKKGRYDTFSMPVVDMLNDTISAVQSTYDEVVKDIDRVKHGVPINTEKLFQTFKDDLIEGSGLLGIPAQNISNLLNAFLSRVGINILAQQDTRRAKDYIKSYGDNYLNGNTEKAKEQLKILYKQEYDKNILKGKERDEAHKAAFSSVRSKLSSTYKLDYQKAFLSGDDKTQTDITNILSKSGYMVFTTNKTLPDVLSDWRENAKKDVNNSYNK